MTHSYTTSGDLTADDRILITIDTDFGELIYLHDIPTCWTDSAAGRAGGAAHRSDVRAN